MAAHKAKSGILLAVLLFSTIFLALGSLPPVRAVQSGTVLDTAVVRFASVPSLNPYAPTYFNPLDSELFPRCTQDDYAPGSPTTLVLCNSWKANSNGTTFTFNLIPGLKWSDGVALNSTDLAYSISAANATGRFSPYLTDVKTLNATGVSMTIPTSEPNLVAIAMGEIFIIPEHAYAPKATFANFGNYTGFDAATVCGGSYCLAQAYVRGTNPIILVPNQNYYLGNQHYYAEVHVHIFASYDAAAAALFSGQVKAMGMPGLQYTTASAVAFQKPGFTVYSFPAPNLFQIVHLNYLKPPFDNINFRQGLAYATDRNLISQAIFGSGFSNLPYGLVLPASSTENQYAYNLTAAEASFVKAGLNYSGTTLQYLNGTQVAFDITYPSGEPDSQSVATLLQLQWAKVGIAATPTLVEDTTLFADYGSGNWGVSTILENGADYSTCCHFIDQMQSSGFSISTLATNHPTQPSDYVTAQIGSLIQQWNSVPLGTSQSDALAQQIAPLMADQVVAIPLWASRGGYVFSNSIYWGNLNSANPVLNTGAYDLQDEVQLQQYHSTWYYAHPVTGPTTTTTSGGPPTTTQTGTAGAIDYTPYIYGGVAVVVIAVIAIALARRRPAKPAS